MKDHYTDQRHAFVRSLQPKHIGWDVAAAVLGALLILSLAFI